MPRSSPSLLLTALAAIVIVACSGELGPPVGSTGAPSAEEAVPPPGVADRGDDPAVVAIYDGEQPICSGALIAPDVVLTAHYCVAKWAPLAACSDAGQKPVARSAPQSIRIVVEDQVASAQERARGRDVVVPLSGIECGADIALVLLDAPIDDVVPLAIRTVGAAKGDRLRTVGFERVGTLSSFAKIVRDHLPVLDATPTELDIGEACERGSGAPAIDESTGEIVGISSRRAGRSCVGPQAFDVYTRTDALLSFVGNTLANSITAVSSRGKKKTKKGPIDMGANCARAADCAAGVCVTEKLQEYCSRTCGVHDQCPARFRCRRSSGGAWVCVEQ